MPDINCFFDITNEKIIKHFNCMFDIADNKVQYNYFKNKKTTKEDYFNIPQICQGYLKDGNEILSNANLYFIKHYENNINEIVNDGINGIKNAERNNTNFINHENIITEKCITDNNGFFNAFVENGIYDIKIEHPTYKGIQKNIKITDGIAGEYYYTINSLIKQRIGKSTFELIDNVSKMINISFLNEYKEIENGVIIISHKNILDVYKNITKDSMFALDNGIYDIKIRNKNTNVKEIKNFEFNQNDDFVNKLINEFNMNNKLNIKENNNEKIK